jgi:hypothetical protein
MNNKINGEDNKMREEKSDYGLAIALIIIRVILNIVGSCDTSHR